jgi:hypothetical protein
MVITAPRSTIDLGRAAHLLARTVDSYPLVRLPKPSVPGFPIAADPAENKKNNMNTDKEKGRGNTREE